MGCSTHTLTIGFRTAILASLFALCLHPLFAGSRTEQPTSVDLSGTPVDPLKAAPGKLVVLLFVRTDCPISNRYAPTIQKLSAQYASKAAFWLVYPDKGESSAAIEAHLHEYG